MNWLPHIGLFTTARYLPAISEVRSSSSTYYHSGIKNAFAQTASNESVNASKRYDAFGNELATSGTWKGNYKYGGPFGYQKDSDSSLQLLGNRYYDPELGRFLTRDVAEDGRNWYAYCGNQPLSYTDYEGLKRLLSVVWALPKGGGGDISPGARRIWQEAVEKYGQSYNVRLRIAKDAVGAKSWLVRSDAYIIFSHLAQGLISMRRGKEMGKLTLDKALNERSAAGKGKLDFIRVYSCSVLADEVFRSKLLLLADRIFGYSTDCYPSEGLESGGKWWR